MIIPHLMTVGGTFVKMLFKYDPARVLPSFMHEQSFSNELLMQNNALQFIRIMLREPLFVAQYS